LQNYLASKEEKKSDSSNDDAVFDDLDTRRTSLYKIKESLAKPALIKIGRPKQEDLQSTQQILQVD